MPPKPPSIYDEYFKITRQYTDQYGTMTILFYQVGAFFEMYGLQDNDGTVSKSKVEDFTQIAQLNMSAKDIDTPDGAVIMAGFRDYSLDKYLKIATQNGYTAVVYTQNATNPKDIKRELCGIYSPGTFISFDTDSSLALTNHIVCIWLSTYTPVGGAKGAQLICGMASAHIFTGESTLFEYQTPFLMNPTTFDELERYISVMAPSEVLVISFLSDKQTTQAIQYAGINTPTVHKIIMESETNPKKIEAVENCQKQKYIKHILSGFFGADAFDVCAEFNVNTYATQAFVYLANFLQEHNTDLVRRLSLPTFQNSGSRMVLANHTLKQLNIIAEHTSETTNRTSSVLAFLNHCLTPMGRRLFQIQMTNPVFDSEWLNAEYDATSVFINMGSEVLTTVRRELSKIKDLDKIRRQIVAKKVLPNSIYFLYEGIQSLCRLNTPVMEFYLGNQEHIHKIASEVLACIDNFLIIQKCKGTDSTFSENVIQPGVSETLDMVVAEYNRDVILFDTIRKVLNDLIRNVENKGDDIEYIKIHETDKSGSSLQITRKRGQILQQALSSITSKLVEFSPDFVIPVKDIRFAKASATNDEIDFPQLSALTKRLLTCKSRLTEEISKAFASFLRTLETDHYTSIENLVRWISRLDVIQSKSYVATRFHYCRPTIRDDAEHSFFDAKGIRHVLIEQLQQNELYVTNDVSLSQNADMNRGILIFGTNAVGKTSLIRAVGICIIMAQCGLYVPCSSFIYKPYTAIFSRILGNDNIFKGLSTFAVEMSELRMILKMADENSLVLGDELCSGTESESALAIFSTGLQDLHAKGTTFLFATHLHEITKYEEISVLGHMGLTHMTVHYDPIVDGLVYDRKLKAGQGDRMYGLEVCKSLYMDEGFLDRAYAFRNKYFQGGELSNKETRYNAKKIKGMCEICQIETSDEIHHLAPQNLASSDGFIGGEFHKNHVANLASICEKCHKKMHGEKDVRMERRKTTAGYRIIDSI